MAYDYVKCFGCGNYGHIERGCPEKTYAAELGDDKPPWCQQCERETRLVYLRLDGRDAARRCTTCHPSGHLLTAQFKRCKTCKAVIYQWDLRSECGKHEPVSKPKEYIQERKPA